MNWFKSSDLRKFISFQWQTHNSHTQTHNLQTFDETRSEYNSTALEHSLERINRMCIGIFGNLRIIFVSKLHLSTQIMVRIYEHLPLRYLAKFLTMFQCRISRIIIDICEKYLDGASNFRPDFFPPTRDGCDSKKTLPEAKNADWVVSKRARVWDSVFGLSAILGWILVRKSFTEQFNFLLLWTNHVCIKYHMEIRCY